MFLQSDGEESDKGLIAYDPYNNEVKSLSIDGEIIETVKVNFNGTYYNIGNIDFNTVKYISFNCEKSHSYTRIYSDTFELYFEPKSSDIFIGENVIEFDFDEEIIRYYVDSEEVYTQSYPNVNLKEAIQTSTYVFIYN